MNKKNLHTIKLKFIIDISIIIILFSVGLTTASAISYSNNSLNITTFDMKELGTALVKNKEGLIKSASKLIEVDNKKPKQPNTGTVTNVAVQPERIWYYPTEIGRISQYPSYYHTAYDITSPRGAGETIYPVARGTVSSMYKDSAGALIVTVRHYIDGRYYSSQYVHLSSYANIYVGQEVTPFTPLGQMGTTGQSTGVHLHLTVVDCNMFDGNDVCRDLNGFFSYARARFNQGFVGLGSVFPMAPSWEGR